MCAQYQCQLSLSSSQIVSNRPSGTFLPSPFLHLQEKGKPFPTFVNPKCHQAFDTSQPLVWSRHPLYLTAWPYQLSQELWIYLQKIFVHPQATLPPEVHTLFIENHFLIPASKADLKSHFEQFIVHTKKQYIEQGHIILPNLIHAPLLQAIQTYLSHREAQNALPWQSSERVHRQYLRDDPLMDHVLQQLVFIGSQCTQQRLTPSYSYVAFYEKTGMKPHRDHPACEWNISIPLGASPPNFDISQWPLWLETDMGTCPIRLNEGQGGLYSGTRYTHWRDPLPPGNKAKVLLLHFQSQENTV